MLKTGVLLTIVALSVGCASERGSVVSPTPEENTIDDGIDTPGKPTAVKILAHVCTWHTYTNHESSWDKATTIPLRGIYDSLDGDVLQEQMTEMTENGITPLVSWHGPNLPDGDGYLDLLLSLPQNEKIVILYEGESRLRKNIIGQYDLSNLHNADIFEQDMRYLYEKYLSQWPKRFVKENDRFVVLIWPTHGIVGAFAELSTYLREELPLYFIGTDLLLMPFVRNDAMDIIPGLDALSGYGIYVNPVARELGGTLDKKWLNRWQASIDMWDTWLEINAPNVRIMIPMQFAFDDSLVRPDTNPILETDYAFAEQMAQTARNLIEEHAEVRDSKKENSGDYSGRIIPWIVFPSYNEHFEGTSIEPSDRYGTKFLDLLRNF